LPGLGYVCQEELCQSNSSTTPMTTTDVIALCQADIPWPLSCPYVTNVVFAQRMVEVGQLCGTAANCSTVPADCKQPTPVAPRLDAGAPSAPELDAGAAPAPGLDAGTNAIDSGT
jgi:hypothetical protein